MAQTPTQARIPQAAERVATLHLGHSSARVPEQVGSQIKPEHPS
jgi:hypothetical protein